MALTITHSPEAFSPVYGPLNIRLTSTLYTNTDFKYIYDVYTVDPSTLVETFRIRIKIIPRPDGSGIYDAHRTLENYLTYKFSPVGTGFVENTESIVVYKIYLGEQYDPGISFTSIADNGSGYLRFTTSSTHGFSSGDEVTINKDNKGLNTDYDGIHAITAVTTYTFDTNVTSTGYNTDTGDVTLRTHLSTNTGVKTAFNGTRQYDEASRAFTSEFTLQGSSGNTRKFLTNFRDVRLVKSTDSGTVSFYDSTGVGNKVTHMLVKTYDSTGALIGNYTIIQSPSITTYRQDYRCFPKNLSTVTSYNLVTSTTTTVFDSNVASYTIQAINGSSYPTVSFTAVSEILEFEVDDTCSKWDNVRLVFMNRLGGAEYFNFDMLSEKTTNISRTEYTKILPYNYSTGDRGDTVLSQLVQDNITVNTDFVNEYTSLWLEELFTSSEVYILDGTTLLPVVITSTTYVAKTTVKDSLKQYTLTLKYSYIKNTQRG